MTINDESFFKEELLKLNKIAYSGKGQVFETYAIHYTELVNSFAKNHKIAGARLETLLSLARQTGSYLSQKELSETEESLAGCCSHGIDPNYCPAGCGDLEHFEDEYEFTCDESDFDTEPAYLNTADSLLNPEVLDCRIREISYKINDLTDSLFWDSKLSTNRSAISAIIKINENFNNIRKLFNINPEDEDFIVSAHSSLLKANRELKLQKS